MMNILVLYTQYAGDLRLLGIYTDDGFALERRMDFTPQEGWFRTLDDVKKLHEENPITFGKLDQIELPKRIEAEKLSAAIKKLIEIEGDEKTLFILANSGVHK